MRLNDLTGRRFGRLTVVERSQNKGRRTMWLCLCDCGGKKVAMSDNLLCGRTKSCGCLNSELTKRRCITHGSSRTRLYNVWFKMLERCRNPKSNRYVYYGARGISVCQEWEHDFGEFKDWAIANGYDESAKRGDCTIDRIDNDGNYCPENCRWVSMKVQGQNKRKRVDT